MAIQPIHLQNLLHGSEQLNKELAAQSQSAHLQQLATGAEIAKKSKPENSQVHELDKTSEGANKVSEDSQSAAEERNAEDKSDTDAKQDISQEITDEHLGNTIDICQ